MNSSELPGAAGAQGVQQCCAVAGRPARVVDAVEARYLECGVLEAGFTRVRCEACHTEYLLGFS